MSGPRWLLSLLGAALVILPVGAAPASAAADTWTVSGPLSAGRHGPTATVRYDRTAGTVTLGVTRDRATVLEPSPLGIVTAQADLSTGLHPIGRSERRVLDRYTTTVGKRTTRTVSATETRFRFAGAGGARLDILVRVSRDGVAYRYALPRSYGNVLREASAYDVPAASAAWLATYSVYYENPFNQTTAAGAAAGEFMHPALFETPGGYLLITESDVDGHYAGARLAHDAGSSRYQVKLADPAVQVTGALTTPWRTMVVGGLDTVSTSTLADDLAPPSKIRDTSWIKPGKAFWSWLAGGREAGESLPIQKSYVDFAAAHGWPYVVVDAGWYFDPNWELDPTWEQTSWLPDLVKYAERRNVKIMNWVHFTDLDTPEEQDRRLKLFASWGIVGLKIDFMDSDAQARFQWYDQILPKLAANHLMVNFHGSTLPHGIYRTWPNVVTMEGVWGAEHSANLSIQHVTALPFTRNVVGSMDYTPMAWHRANRPTSDAHELALSVIFESGVQNLAGRVADYDARPEAERYLDQVPTVWDETRLLAGRPAESAVFARRSGERWFVGAGYAGAAHTASVPLNIGSGRWLVDIVRDGPTGLVREQRTVRGGAALTVDVAANGGFAAIACRWRPGLKTCDKPVSAVPGTDVTVSPATVDVPPSTSFTVSGTFTNRASGTLRDVSLAPRVPAGWTVRGATGAADRLRPGQSVGGTWVVSVPDSIAPGYLSVPIVAQFRTNRGGKVLEDQQTIRVHSWKPLPAGWTYLSDLPFTTVTNGLGPVEKDTTNGQAAAGDGRGIAMRRAAYGKGLGMFAPAEVSFSLAGRCTAFASDVGLDDEASLDIARTKLGGTVAFSVLGDGVTRAESGTVDTHTPAKPLTADLTGVQTLTLKVGDGGDGTVNDRASWADARVHCS
jgi:alpha-glucosidase